MNRLNLLFGMLALASVFALNVPAQRKIISSKEYIDAVMKPLGPKYYEKSRRVETMDEILADGVVTKSVFRIYEVLLPNRAREYSKTIEGDKATEFEQITIDYMQYTRKDGGAWIKVDLRQSGSLGYGSGSASGSTRQLDQYSVETTSINGQSTQLYDWLSIDTSSNELMFHEMRKWIGIDGLPYREEDLRGKLSPREDTKRIITTYDYDPKITIEAPVK
jgi:hypothetical protein